MKRIASKNLAPKIISILFSLILWIYVMGTINPRDSRILQNMPVSLSNVQELKEQGLVLVGENDFKIRVRLTGRRDEIYKVSPEQIQIKADLRGYRLGVNDVPLDVSIPNANNIDIDINPRFIRVELEEIVKKQRDVKVVITGQPKENFAVGELNYKPTVVQIEGPESYVNAVESVVARLDISGKSEDLLLSLPLKPVNSRGEEVAEVDVKTSYADVSLGIDLLKSVPIKENHQITTSEGYEIVNIEINPKEVVLKGKQEILKDIAEVTTELVEIENLNEDQVIDVKLDLPEGIIVQGESSIKMKISVEKIEERTYKINRDKIIFNNLDENLKIDKEDIPENMEVKVVALSSVLDNIKETDITIAVDLSNLNANEYTIEPVLHLPFIIERDVKELRLEPKAIQIKLVEKK